MMANLVDVGTQNEVTDAHGSKNTTQVALRYQQIDPSLTYPRLSPLSSPQNSYPSQQADASNWPAEIKELTRASILPGRTTF